MKIFLDSFSEAYAGERIGLVVDNAPSHQPQVIWPKDIVPLYLPPYSPELNPAEQIFRVLKQRLSNTIFDDEYHLHEAIIAELKQFWDNPEQLVQLTAYPWWRESISGIRKSHF